MSENPDAGNSGEVHRRVRTKFDDNMTPSSDSSASPESCKIRALGIWPARTLVPVIFLPGIMGSNLCSKKDKASAWVPPNGIGAGLGEYGRRKKQIPKERQQQLTADDVEVFDVNKDIKISDDYIALDKNEAKRRHWGEIHADSYLEILSNLEEKLNHPFVGVEYSTPHAAPDWVHAMNPKKKKWTPKSPLTEDEFKNRMGEIYLPVYACGYNWLESNEESAKRVIARIEEIEKRTEGNGYYSYSGQVILVTHSMGGLVGRRVAQMLDEKGQGNKILGVVHGVQPVTGAPAVYRRFKAGTETGGFFDIAGAVAAVILGWDAADVTCVLGNSPGPMELLPTKDYGAGWLHITDGDKTIQLPKADPYEEIYSVSAEDKWWGMVDPGLLDPAGKLKDHEDTTPRKYFLKQLEKAQTFHETVGLTCHPNTYAYYGDDPCQHSFNKVVWHTTQKFTGLSDDEVLDAPRGKFKLTGRTEALIGESAYTFKLNNKSDPGDGTVPTPSGAAASRLEGIKDVYTLDGFDHQFSYKNEIAQHTVLYAIGKMVQAIELKEDGTCKPI